MTQNELDELRASLLHRLRLSSPLGPDEAFDQHLLLAVRVHRAALLNQEGDKEGEGWTQFVTAYFPPGRNGPDEARLLWKEWRTALVKNEPGGVSLRHGRPDLHWKLDGHGDPIINLESMADDFEYAVDQFIQALAADEKRAVVVRDRWQKRAWTIRPLTWEPQQPLGSVSGFTGVIPGAEAVTGSNPTTR